MIVIQDRWFFVRPDAIAVPDSDCHPGDIF
jgi:hypothetical protein